MTAFWTEGRGEGEMKAFLEGWEHDGLEKLMESSLKQEMMSLIVVLRDFCGREKW